MAIVVGIDTGTQSTKVLCYDVEKKDVVFVASAPHTLISREDGSREQEAHWYIDAIRTCFSQITPEIKKHIIAIGVSGQQHGFVPLDKDGQVLAPVKLWCDTSTARQCTELTERLGGEEAVFALLGNQILPGYTVSKILFLKENNPEAYDHLAHILLPHDYINFYLTGTYSMEAGDASGTAMFDVRTKTWCKEVLFALDDKKDLLGMLPPILEAGQSCGTVLKTVCKELGIPDNVVVSTGGGDNMMGAIGTGCVQGGTLAMSMGTSGTLFGYSDSCVADGQGRLAAFCSSSGGYLPLLCTMNCTITTEAVRSLLGYEVKELDSLAAKAPIGCNGVTMLPYFNGERVPNFPKGKGVLAGFDISNMKAGNIARAALESSVFAMRGGLEAFREQGFVPKRLILTGGGAKSSIWRRITCDVMQLPLEVPEVAESAAFGAALQAFWTVKGGEIESIVAEHVQFDSSKSCELDVSVKDAYDKAYDRYRQYVGALGPMFR